MADQLLRQRSDREWRDVNKASKGLVALVLATALIANGCAGVVMGSSSPGSGTPPPSSPPPGAPPPTNTPQPQLSATPMSASFPTVATGARGSQTITLNKAR